MERTFLLGIVLAAAVLVEVSALAQAFHCMTYPKYRGKVQWRRAVGVSVPLLVGFAMLVLLLCQVFPILDTTQELAGAAYTGAMIGSCVGFFVSKIYVDEQLKTFLVMG